jgi:hypothetical protein
LSTRCSRAIRSTSLRGRIRQNSMNGRHRTKSPHRRCPARRLLRSLYPFCLDTDMSMAFAAAITGGVSLEEEQIDRLTDTSRFVRALRGNLKVWRAGEIGGGVKRPTNPGPRESRSIRRHTDASILITLYDELRRTGNLHINPTFDELEVGSLAALDMSPAVAPLRRVLDQVRRLLDPMAPVLGLDVARDTRGATAAQQRGNERSTKEVDPERSEALTHYQSLKNLFDALTEDLQHSGMIDHRRRPRRPTAGSSDARPAFRF